MCQRISSFKDAPVGARFKFLEEDLREEVWVKIHANGDGLIVQWNGNIIGHQSHCCWIDDDHDFDTKIELI